MRQYSHTLKKENVMKKVKCINNENYLTSLTVGQEYIVLADEVAQSRGRIRIIDNTNESYLYPVSMFEITET